MKKTGTYIISVILSVLLVFGLLGSAAAAVMCIKVNPGYCTALAEENDIPEKVYSELNRHYSEKYNSSGIPAEVYMNAIDEEYIRSVVDVYITAGFDALDFDTAFVAAMPKNTALENSIDDFFNSYADEIGYEKDAAFERKLSETKSNAYAVIGSYSDIYKFSSMSSHGVLTKLAKIYRHKSLLTADILGFTAIILLLLMLVNIRERRTILYWSGICSVIAGILGLVPCIWLSVTRYFDSFTIKQPQVFAAFTGLMYKSTGLMTVLLSVMVSIGAVLLVIYAFVRSEKNIPSTEGAIKEKH